MIETFFEQFELLADSPNGVQKLRELILQLAVQGKLVPQDPDDEPASVLWKRITSQRKKLIQEKKIGKCKDLPAITASEILYSLPDGWLWLHFGDVLLDIEAGASPQCEKYPKQKDEWGVIKISAVSWDKFNPDENKALPKEIQPNPKHEVHSGDFLMSRANTSQLVGKSVVVENTPPRLLINDKTLRVFFPEFINKRFFNLYNNSPVARAYYAKQGTGTSESMRNITREQIRCLPVPVPPAEEQRRIVEKVDRLMKLCDELEERQKKRRESCIRLNEGAIAQLLSASSPEESDRHWQRICNNFDLLYNYPENIDKLRQAILQLAVDGKLEADFGSSWKKLEINDLCTAIQTGPFGSLLHASDYIAGGIPLINPQNIQEGSIRITPDKTVSAETCQRLKNYILQKNDVILARRGEVGRCAVISDREHGWLCGTGSLFLRLLPDVSPRFIKLLLDAPLTRAKLQSTSVGSTMNNLNQRIISSLPVAIPSIAEQMQIVSTVDRLMKLCDELEAKLQHSYSHQEKLMETAARQLIQATANVPALR